LKYSAIREKSIMTSLAGFVIAASAVVGQAETTLPQEVVNEFSNLIGDWKMTGTEGDKAYKAKYSMKWVPGKYAYVSEMFWSGPDSEGPGRGLVGWDASSKEIVVLEAWSDGFLGSIRYTIKSQGVLEGPITMSTAAGGKYKANARMEMKDEDTWVYTAT
jgi:hypothetical protein